MQTASKRKCLPPVSKNRIQSSCDDPVYVVVCGDSGSGSSETEIDLQPVIDAIEALQVVTEAVQAAAEATDENTANLESSLETVNTSIETVTAAVEAGTEATAIGNDTLTEISGAIGDVNTNLESVITELQELEFDTTELEALVTASNVELADVNSELDGISAKLVTLTTAQDNTTAAVEQASTDIVEAINNIPEVDLAPLITAVEANTTAVEANTAAVIAGATATVDAINNKGDATVAAIEALVFPEFNDTNIVDKLDEMLQQAEECCENGGTVTPDAELVAVGDAFPSATAGTTTPTSVIDNDTVDGNPADTNNVIIKNDFITVLDSDGNPSSDITMNPNGTLNIGEDAVGDYTVNYSICDPNSPTNCASADVLLNVASISAVDDTTSLGISQTSEYNVLDNDMINGQPAADSNPTVTLISAEDSLGNAQAGITLNSDGTITVDPTVPQGEYTLVYQIDDAATGLTDQAEVALTVTETDTDFDGVPDSVDLDDDNDGILDTVEDQPLPVLVENLDMSGIVNSVADGVPKTFTFADGTTRTVDISTNLVNVDPTTEFDGFNTGIVSTSFINSNFNNNTGWFEVIYKFDKPTKVQMAYPDPTSLGTHGSTSIFGAYLPEGGGFDVFDPNGGVEIHQNTDKDFSYSPDSGGRTTELQTAKRNYTITTAEPVTEFVLKLANGDHGNKRTSVRVNIVQDPVNSIDLDGDGVINSLDWDSDNDGIPDAIEAQDTDTYVSINETVASNSADGTDVTYTPVDSDEDGTPDYLDIDSDGDGISDDVETTNVITPTAQQTDGGVDPSTLTNQEGDTSEVGYREGEVPETVKHYEEVIPIDMSMIVNGNPTGTPPIVDVTADDGTIYGVQLSTDATGGLTKDASFKGYDTGVLQVAHAGANRGNTVGYYEVDYLLTTPARIQLSYAENPALAYHAKYDEFTGLIADPAASNGFDIYNPNDALVIHTDTGNEVVFEPNTTQYNVELGTSQQGYTVISRDKVTNFKVRIRNKLPNIITQRASINVSLIHDTETP